MNASLEISAAEAAHERDVLVGVISFLALTSGTAPSAPSALWQLAEDHGWTLGSFAESVVDLMGPIATEHIEHHLAAEAASPMVAPTFNDAREIVRTELALTWPESLGTLHVSEVGHENATTWHVCAGPESQYRDDLEDGDMICGAPAYLVDKRTGVFTIAAMVASLDLIYSMTEVTA